MRLTAVVLAVVLALPGAATARAAGADDGAVLEHALELFRGDGARRAAARDWLVERGGKDAIAALIQALRFSRRENEVLVEALAALAGESAADSWFDWMEWQQAHPEIVPFEGFDAFKASVFQRIDPAFDVFIYEGVAHEIRLEEIAWGGVGKDGIPALTNPKLTGADEATYLTGEELVFGVSINGDERAYPLRLMDWHEMFNDVIGGVPVSLAYCTLCGSGILFETMVEGREAPFVFGSSGFLYRSNKLMYDQETHSLWNQFTGRPVVGALTGSGIELATRPVVITSWAAWRDGHPETRVLSLDTGFSRDYRPGMPYQQYFASPDLMFPALVDETSLKAKDYVFALRGTMQDKAWPLALFEAEPVINDRAGIQPVTLVGDPATRTVRAYRTNGETFTATDEPDVIEANGGRWQVTETHLVGPAGERWPRLPGHIAYWFAWAGYLGEGGEVATGSQQ